MYPSYKDSLSKRDKYRQFSQGVLLPSGADKVGRSSRGSGTEGGLFSDGRDNQGSCALKNNLGRKGETDNEGKVGENR